MVIDDVAENDIRGVFGISSLPKALALRKQIIDSPQFLSNFGDYRIYVAFIDSKTMPAEFGYKFRDWINKHEKEENTAFAVLDLSYIDGSNYDLARSFGLSQKDAPTIFTLERPNTGNYFK